MDKLKIVKGNTFETIIPVKAYKYSGGEMADFDLKKCTNIKITVRTNGSSRNMEQYSILDDNKIHIIWPANKLVIGEYFLEVSGKLNNADWRFYDKTPIFTIVNTNSEANIPK